MPKKRPEPDPSPLAVFTQLVLTHAAAHPADFLKNTHSYHTTIDAIASTTRLRGFTKALKRAQDA